MLKDKALPKTKNQKIKLYCSKRKKSELQHSEIQLEFDLIKVQCFFCGIKKLSPKE